MSFEVRTVAAALALVLALSAGAATHARQRSRAGRGASAPQKKRATKEPESELARLRAELVQATKDFKSNLEQLLALYRAEVRRAEERVAKTKELYEAGFVSKRELERDEGEAATARAKVGGLEWQLKNADVQIAQTLVEAEAEEEAAKALARASRAPRSRGSLVSTTAYIRFGGSRAWSLGEAGAVAQFYARSFGRQLPVSAFGQSPVHDRLGFDHRNAMDVGVSPDSAEGRALMDFLRASGIPFIAFRHAVPGSSTGPHIHVGRPSARIR